MKGGAAAEFAIHLDDAVVFVDDAVRDRKTEAGAGGLGGEKRIEHMGQVFRRNARPVVLNAQAQARHGDRLAPQVVLVRRHVDHFGAHNQVAAFGDRVDRVQEKVEQRLCQHVRVAVDAVDARLELALEIDVALAELLFHEVQRVVDDAVQVHRGQAGFRRPGKPQELIHDPVDARHFVAEQVGKRFAEIRVIVSLGQQLGERLHRHQRVFDFVGHARGEGAKTGEAVGAANLLFQFFNLRLVGKHHQRAEHFSRVAVEQGAPEPDRHFAVADHQAAVDVAAAALIERLLKREGQRGRQRGDVGVQHVFAAQSGDAFGLAVKHRDGARGIHRDHPADEAIEQDVVVNAAVLHLGVQLGIFQGDRELIGEAGQHRELDRAVDAGGGARTEQHQPDQLALHPHAGERGDPEIAHALFHLLQGLGRTQPLDHVEHQRFGLFGHRAN